MVAVGSTTSPVNVGEAKFAFRSSALCCAVLTGLFKSEVLSRFPIPKLVRALLALAPPVPPFATSTTPETLLALPISDPVITPTRFPVTFPVTLPMILEVIFVAIKLPEASRLTSVLAVF